MAIQEDPPAGVPDWVVTFGDMMSLLLTFFVLLFSMSEVKSDKRFQAMADSFRKQFGYSTSRKSLTPGQHIPLNSRVQRMGSEEWSRSENMQNAREQKRMVGLDRHRLWTNRSGERPTEGTIITFSPLESTLSDRERQRLQQAARQLRGKLNKIEIRGHATGLPPDSGSTYQDDWQLAFARCYQTMQYLVEHERIDRRRIRLNVAGKNEPIYTGTSPDLLAANSRVEVFLLSELTEPLDNSLEIESQPSTVEEGQ